MIDASLVDAFRHAWDALDNDDERATLRNDALVGDLHGALSRRHLPSVRRASALIERPSTLTNVPHAYAGARLTGAVTLAFCRDLLVCSLRGETLHYTYAAVLVSALDALLRSTGPLQRITVSPGARIVIVGDIHGQLSDFATLIECAGWPSVSNMYLFNGDFVDRGANDCEVLWLIYALKLAMPESVFLNRGNHELRRMNEKYGFLERMLDRYDSDLYERVLRTFEWLPLCAVVNDRLFVVHGGLFQYADVLLAEIETLDSAGVRGADLPRRAHLTERAQFLVENMLWSDPAELTECLDPPYWIENARGAGIIFGMKAAERFLTANGLQSIVRSHQLVDGHAQHWGGLMHTVFSASYYGGANSNLGAVLVYCGDETNWRQPHGVLTYTAPHAPDQAAQQREQMRTTLERLYECIYEFRPELHAAFSSAADASGVVSLPQWGRVLTSVTRLSLQWNLFLPYLACIELGGGINYARFLAQFQIGSQSNSFVRAWQIAVVASFASKLSERYGDLRTAFSALDVNGDGFLSYEEWASALEPLGVGADEAHELLTYVDTNRDGRVDLKEFDAHFGLVLRRALVEVQLKGAIGELQEHVTRAFRGDYHAAFRAIDSDQNRAITYREWSHALKVWSIVANAKQRRELFAYVDANASGTISHREFARAFATAPHDRALRSVLLHRLLNAVWRARVQLRASWRMLDADNSRRLEETEFRSGLEALGETLGESFSSQHMQLLMQTVPRDGSGLIRYEDFLASFIVQRVSD